MKVVINDCYGGFSLSAAAMKRYLELQGRECYFFDNGEPLDFKTLRPRTQEQAEACFLWHAYDIPNPQEIEDRDTHYISDRDIERNDPLLIQVVEEMGADHCTGASGACAHLKIIEIPDDVEWEIKEYDGTEWVAEVHRTWV
jgi:hypothetical protein